MSRRLWRRAILTLLFVALALVAGRTLFAPEVVPVRVAPVERGLVEQTVTNSRAGTVKARRRALLSPETGGRVARLPFARGERVKRGDVVLALDSALEAAQLAVTERELVAARAREEQACLAAAQAARERRRNEDLAPEGIVSEDLLDRVRSAAETAEAACRAAQAAREQVGAARELARVQLDKRLLRAPFDGIVAELSIEVGEWTTPSPPVLPVPAVVDLIDPSSLYLSAPMDEVDSARIRPGLEARVTVDSHPGRSFPAHVTRVAAFVLDRLEENRTVEIEVELDDPQLARTLLPGTSADAEVVLERRPDVLRVPTAALIAGERVLLLAGERLVERTVELGVRNWDWSEIRAGLAAGERVVLSLDRPEVKKGARARVEEAP